MPYTPTHPDDEAVLRLEGQKPRCQLLFRCGDFYETYAKDAVTAAQVLGITLTRRNNKEQSATEMAISRTMRSTPICHDSSGQASVWPSAAHWRTRN